MNAEDSGLTLNYQLYFPLATRERKAGIVFPCPHCGSKLEIKPEENIPPARDLSCPSCNGVFILSGCGRCKALFGVTADMRADLSRTGSLKCPNCETELICFLWPHTPPSLFEMDGKGGFELVLTRRNKAQRFEISERSALVFECLACKVEIHKTGVLHEPINCVQCDAYNYLIACPNCAQLFPVSREMKDDLGTVITCTHCETFLVWPKIYVEISGTSTRSLRQWGDDDRERNFLSRSNAVLGDPEKTRLAVYHSTTGGRLSGAESHLAELQRLKLNIFRVNTGDLAANVSASTGRPKHSQESMLDVYSFGFLNSLRSSLDILVQELAILFSLSAPEGKIDFSLRQISGGLPSAIEDHLLDFQRKDDYVYLNRLRNAVQHRRIWLGHTKSVFNTHPVTGGEEPVSTKLLLPDDPNALPGKQKYTQERELVDTFSSLLVEVREFIFGVYDLAARIR